MVLTLIFTGSYSIADLGTDLDIGNSFFLINDSFTIFTVFIVIFELARFSLNKTKRTDLSFRDVLIVSIVVSLYGILFQILMDPTAAALGIYYYQNPPAINIFGFPIWFITSFAIYGLYAFIFLLVERYYDQKKYI
jgi:polyferredoxin